MGGRVRAYAFKGKKTGSQRDLKHTTHRDVACNSGVRGGTGSLRDFGRLINEKLKGTQFKKKVPLHAAAFSCGAKGQVGFFRVHKSSVTICKEKLQSVGLTWIT